MIYQPGMRLVDERGTAYILGPCLGTGGQGSVFSAEGGRVALKLLTLPELTAQASSTLDRLRLRISGVKRLPLERLSIARPLELLRRPHLGYVMERLTGMMPVSRLTIPPTERAVEWYLETGGLRRRLKLLAGAADVLLNLHSRGLVYGDISPHNLFISDHAKGLELRFIDADNLCFESAPSDHPYFTPFYGAPEIILGRSGNNTLSDAHAFSVLAFELLTLVHPLLGDLVSEGDPALEQDALEGRLPWIDHPADSRNATPHGLPRSTVLSPLLRELVQQSFGPGLTTALDRPGISAWSELLHAAAHATLGCPGCKATYYMNENLCPWCDQPRPAFALLRLERWDADAQQRVPLRQATAPARSLQPSWRQGPAPYLALEANVPLILTGRHTGPEGGEAALKPQVELHFSGECLSMRSASSEARDFCLLSPDGHLEPVREGWRELAIRPGKPTWDLHFGPLNTGHRVARFEYRPAHIVGGAA